MTGRDLIIYILENNLENEPIYKDGKILGFISTKEAALEFGVGFATIELWFELGIIPGIKIGEELYIPVNALKGVEAE